MDDTAMDNELAAWDDRQPDFDRKDPLWTLLAYRLARWMQHLLAEDLRFVRGISLEAREQLDESVTSIAANLAEGHSRTTPRDRSRFYGYALGSTREAGVRYASIARALPDGVAEARMAILSRIRRLTFGLIRRGDTPRWIKARRPPNPEV